MGEILKLRSEVVQDNTTAEISKNFDYIFDGGIETDIAVPTFPSEFEIGLIVGSSGSGKSTILRKCFGEEEDFVWDDRKCIASHFDSYEDASEKLGAVGLNSIPSWLKPYSVLSTGEKFRADMAVRLKDGAVIDEFTSVVNREVAISCSCSISKYVRKKGLRNIVFCSCHDDIIPYLNPTWVYNTDTKQFYTGRYLCRPQINLEIIHCNKKTWDLFKGHHYLSGDLNDAAICFLATLDDIPVAFLSVLSLPGRDVQHAWREHRLVVLPDYQGMGIGNRFSETIGQAYREKGCRYFAKTSNPRCGEHRDNSPLWRATVNNHKSRESYLDKNGDPRGHPRYGMKKELVEFHSHRVCYCHEYIGDGTEYPYTYESSEVSDEIVGQMSIFDFLQGAQDGREALRIMSVEQEE